MFQGPHHILVEFAVVALRVMFVVVLHRPQGLLSVVVEFA
jgi:hypothetical protein